MPRLTSWGIKHNDTPPRHGSFRLYADKAEAERVAEEYRTMWPGNTYRVLPVRCPPDPQPLVFVK